MFVSRVALRSALGGTISFFLVLLPLMFNPDSGDYSSRYLRAETPYVPILLRCIVTASKNYNGAGVFSCGIELRHPCLNHFLRNLQDSSGLADESGALGNEFLAAVRGIPIEHLLVVSLSSIGLLS